MLEESYFNHIKGAVYYPSRAYNAWQTWNEFTTEEIDRDFGYAEDAGINALRMFTSFEYWQEAPEEFFEKFEKLIAVSVKHQIRMMPVLFEDCGKDNTPENRQDKHPLTAVCVCSPCRAIQQDPSRWVETHAFVDAFMRKYANDSRLLAIEVMNEPNARNKNIPFAQHAVKLCAAYKGSVPLTIGCISLWHNLYFDEDLGVYQYHDNFPHSAEFLGMEMREASVVQEMKRIPCWLTEWQRVRTQGPGWDTASIPEEDKVPALHTLATTVYESGMGSFFWSLMVHPAYLMAQRPNGTFNGLFHEDGSVYSLEDYQAIAGKDKVRPEKKEIPEWYRQSLEANR